MNHAAATLERLRPRSVLLSLGAGALACLAGTAIAGPTGDAGLLGAALSCAVAAGVFAAWRHRVDRLPLALSERALRGSFGARPAYRFRARLGHGRTLHDARARVVFHPDGEPPREVPPTLAALPLATGPWTLVVVDDGAIADRPGRFEVEVTATEGPRRWRAARSWRTEELRPGRFGGDVAIVGGRLVVDPTAWEAVIEDPSP